MLRTAPLFRLDPGWLYVIAGLALCTSGILIPAREDLHALDGQLQAMEDAESQAYARLRAYSDFLDGLERQDPKLLRRLAATHLNLMPEGDQPVLLTTSTSASVAEWIEAGLVAGHADRPAPSREPSLLGRLATGRHRLWLMGAGVLWVFIGLLLTPGLARPPGEEDEIDEMDEEPTEPYGDGLAVGAVTNVEKQWLWDEAEVVGGDPDGTTVTDEPAPLDFDSPIPFPVDVPEDAAIGQVDVVERIEALEDDCESEARAHEPDQAGESLTPGGSVDDEQEVVEDADLHSTDVVERDDEVSDGCEPVQNDCDEEEDADLEEDAEQEADDEVDEDDQSPDDEEDEGEDEEELDEYEYEDEDEDEEEDDEGDADEVDDEALSEDDEEYEEEEDEEEGDEYEEDEDEETDDVWDDADDDEPDELVASDDGCRLEQEPQPEPQRPPAAARATPKRRSSRRKR